jgi:ElaB/YqjD/DUF883 family membrane-anchored ribosome-binding protein
VSRDRIAELRDELARLADELGEVGLDVLRRAVDDGATARPPEEKALAQARRAVEKAVAALEPHARD